MEKRYKVLRIIGTFFKLVGIFILLITILLVLGLLVSVVFGALSLNGPDHAMMRFSMQPDGMQVLGPLGGMISASLLGLVSIVNGILLSLIFYALGDGIYLFLAIEENTRQTAELLKQNRSGVSVPEIPKSD